MNDTAHAETRGTAESSAQLTRPGIYILPTRHGLLFGLMLLFMLAGAVNYNSSLGYAFSFLLGGVGLVSIVHTYRNMAGLRFVPGTASHAFAGTTASYEVIAINATARARYDVRLRTPARESAPVHLEAGESQPVVLKKAAPKRGIEPLGRVTVTSRFPLGLFYSWAHIELPLDAVIYPKPGAPSKPPDTITYDADAAGERGIGAGDFRGFRSYSPGDSPRHIFWKAFAAGRDLVTKQFGSDYTRERWFEWDSTPGADTEARLSQMCRWILDADKTEEAYGLRLPGVTVPVGTGHQHRNRCLEALARF
jgi:uncharacterized protein (DUF58 family)